MEFMPENAPLVVLSFLGTCFFLGVAGVATVYGLARQRRGLMRIAVTAALAGAGIYAGLLLAVSLASREKVLGPGELKYFCEVDCHLAYSVVGVTTTKTLGAPPRQATAAGTFYVVKVKTWFDERTISSRRGNAPLWPNPRRITVLAEQGREYAESREGRAALESAAAAQVKNTPLTQPLRPGGSYTTELVFDLPENVKNPRLLITDADAARVTHFLIGHEKSFLHKKIFFGLAPQLNSAAIAAP